MILYIHNLLLFNILALVLQIVKHTTRNTWLIFSKLLETYPIQLNHRATSKSFQQYHEIFGTAVNPTFLSYPHFYTTVEMAPFWSRI